MQFLKPFGHFRCTELIKGHSQDIYKDTSFSIKPFGYLLPSKTNLKELLKSSFITNFSRPESRCKLY